MHLIDYRITNHVASTVLKEFRKACYEHGFKRQRSSHAFGKLIRRYPKLLNYRFFRRKSKKNFFSIIMYHRDLYLNTPLFTSDSVNNSLYVFDVWPFMYQEFYKLILKTNINTIFFSSKINSKDFKNTFPRKKVYWLPEGIDVGKYKSFDYDERNIDIINFGRKYDVYHSILIQHCTEKKLNYLYSKDSSSLTFKNEIDFLNGLGRSKISICFPQNITHPNIAGKISKMTARYLQSMASRCLIIGAMPDEMKELFNYCPIIEADMNRPADQINYILKNYTEFIPLIRKNYLMVAKQHTWDNRIEKVMDVLI